MCVAVGASGVIATVVFGLYGNATAAWGMTAKARPLQFCRKLVGRASCAWLTKLLQDV